MIKATMLIAGLLLLLFALPVYAGEEEPMGAVEPFAADVGLDPGHSKVDVGAVGGGLKEYELTLAVATRVKQLLEEEGLTVAVSRQDDLPLTGLRDPDPTERIRLEQEARVATVGRTRVYVSIHFNGLGNPRVRGAECYYNLDNHGEESRLLAMAIQDRLLGEVAAAGYDLPDRGVKEDLLAGKPYGHFFSLRGPAPSVLVESMFLTNPHEAFLLSNEDVREAVARGIAGGIANHLRPHAGPLP